MEGFAMDSKKRDVARQLRSLEIRFEKEGRIPDAELDHWMELAVQLFGPAAEVPADHPMGARRRSFRVPTDVPAHLRVAGEAVTCRVVQLSQTGATIAGLKLVGVAAGSELELVDIAPTKEPVAVGSPCRLVHIDVSGQG